MIAARTDRLLVIVPDRVSLFVEKGEVVNRYYNPGDLFDEVHLLLTNDDRPDPQAVQRLVGSATPVVHNLPAPSFGRTAGWQVPLLRRWREAGVALAAEITPSLVRTMNNFVEGDLASEIKARLRIPFVMSLHGVWDRDMLTTTRERVISRFRRKLEIRSLGAADAVIAVYAPIVRYANAYGAKRVELIYNAVAGEYLSPKSTYDLTRPPRILTINRQSEEKSPENVIRALRDIECRYVVVGDGPCHERLRRLSAEVGGTATVEFVKAIPNEELLRTLPDFDLMVSRCDYWGMSKTLIEGALAGLPIVVNHHPVQPIPEYEGDWLRLCANTPEGYRDAICELLADESSRRELGQRARHHATETFDPALMEARTVALYRSVLGGASVAAK